MKTTNTHRLSVLSASALYILSAGHPVLAAGGDDTEVLVGPGGQEWATPNVLFVMDTSGSMARDVDGNNPPADGQVSRLATVQAVFENLMQNNFGINVALMRFDTDNNGGYFVSPMQELNDSSRQGIIDAANGLSASSYTPLSETFYEAARFWRGMSVDYGDSSNPGTNVSGVLDPNNTANYLSPITSQCQRNYTILLTDGEPTRDTDADSKVQSDFLNGSTCDGNEDDGKCLDDIAGYLYDTDQNTSIEGKQTVETYTIGFAMPNQQLLQDTGLEGGGKDHDVTTSHYFTANNATELAAAFAEIFDAISDTNNSFSAPALGANAFSGVAHFNKLYYALFAPDAAPKWVGNVKPYIINDDYNLEDANGNVAIDANGIFLPTSRSFWSTGNDGANIGAGGANGQLPTPGSTRKLYTYTGDYSTTSNFVLSAPSNALENSPSSNLTAAMLSLSNTDAAALELRFNAVLQATRDADLGAPLHSQPALVIYDGPETSPDMTLFVATNDGFLHAINAATGIEKFAFVPKELLPNLPILEGGTGSVVYGLDGDVSVWANDINGDSTIDSSAGDHVFVYVGMRRGGNNYYALDVTDRDAPVLKWVIKGGPGGTPGFEELGQSWSKPKVTSIPYGTGSKKVLIFAGGYDTRQDANPINNTAGDADTIGRALFIVDADNGSLLWSAGPNNSFALSMANLTHSIPSNVRLLDSDLDGNTDRLYVGDMRGQIFRFDLRADTSTTLGGVTGTGVVFAQLSGTTEADNRRFYYAPDVVVTRNRNAAAYISVNIGSGYRAHPLNPLVNGVVGNLVNDRFYSLRDNNVIGVATGSAPIITHLTTHSSSSAPLDITNSPVLSTADSQMLNNMSGWYIDLGNSGEKVLAPAVTISGEVFFTTYTPPSSVPPSNCAPPPGKGRLYRMSLFDGSPVTDQNQDGDNSDATDRTKDLNRAGLPPAPTAMFRENSSGTVELVACVGTECEPLPNAIQIQPTYWQEGL